MNNKRVAITGTTSRVLTVEAWTYGESIGHERRAVATKPPIG